MPKEPGELQRNQESLDELSASDIWKRIGWMSTQGESEEGEREKYMKEFKKRTGKEYSEADPAYSEGIYGSGS